MEMFIDVLLDAAIDCVKMLPFLFLAFLLIEALEHYSSDFTKKLMVKVDKARTGCRSNRRMCPSVWIFGYGSKSVFRRNHYGWNIDRSVSGHIG